MKKLAALAALSASGLALSAPGARADYTLNILHINDWHSRIESNNKYESTCSVEEEGKGECIGGAARLVSAISAEREKLKGQNVLLLNGGDNFQGSLFYSTYKGKVEAEFLNAMRFDAMTVGNHEFDDGEDALAPFLDVIRFPVLSANVAASAASRVGDRIKPSVVLTVGGERIGIVGAVTTDTPEIASPGPNIRIADDVATITAEVRKLQGQGVNKIIALTHVGYPRDKEMIARIPGVDVVVGGHTHSLLSNTDARAEGPYPTMVENPEGYRVPVTQAASYSKYLGAFTVVFDDRGAVKSAAGDPIFLDKAVKPDPAVLARIKELGAPIEALKQTIVGETSGPIDGSRDNCRARECAMGNLVSDAVLDRVKGQGVSIVITNGGGLRASIDGGPVSMGEVLTVLPFQNTVATFQLAGSDIVAALENGASQLEEKAGRFAQVAGLKYSFDPAAPAGSRIRDVLVRENNRWTAIDPATLYLVATNNYVRQGGDGYKVFADKAQKAYDYGPQLEQVVADYLGSHSPYTPRLYGRITEVAASKAPAQAMPSGADTAAAAAPVPQLPAGSTDIVALAPSVAPAAPATGAAPAEALLAQVPTIRAQPPAPADTATAPAGTQGSVPAEPAAPTQPEQPATAQAPAQPTPPAGTEGNGTQPAPAGSGQDGTAAPVPPESGSEATPRPAAPAAPPSGAAAAPTPAAAAPAPAETQPAAPAAPAVGLNATTPVPPASGPEAVPTPTAPAAAEGSAATAPAGPATGTDSGAAPVPPASGPEAVPAPAAPAAETPTVPAAPSATTTPAPAGTQPAAPAAGSDGATTPVPSASGPEAVPAPSAPATDAPAGSGGASPPAESASEPAPPARAPAQEPAAAAPAPAGTSYVIVEGDSYWKLAERFYEDGFQWKRIAQANPAQKELDLTIGATITIPPAP